LTVNDINTALIAIKKNLVKGANGNEQLQDVDVNVDVNIAQNCTYCAADSTTIKGAELFQGCSIKVLFTSAITGSNTISPLTINYNNVDITVKVGKNGTLVDFVAYNTGSGFVYCQAYTTLELLFDGNNFVIMGNPVVISNSDYVINTDGSVTYTSNAIDRLRPRKIYEQKTSSFEVDIGSIELVLLDWRGYAAYVWVGLIFSFQSSVSIFPIMTNTATTPIGNNAHLIYVEYEGQQPMVTRYKMNNVNFY
jgi:hypothetical protein